MFYVSAIQSGHYDVEAMHAMSYKPESRMYKNEILSQYPALLAVEPLQRHLLRRGDRRVVIGHQSNS